MSLYPDDPDKAAIAATLKRLLKHLSDEDFNDVKLEDPVSHLFRDSLTRVELSMLFEELSIGVTPEDLEGVETFDDLVRLIRRKR